jgi:hypothetical protein
MSLDGYASNRSLVAECATVALLRPAEPGTHSCACDNGKACHATTTSSPRTTAFFEALRHVSPIFLGPPPTFVPIGGSGQSPSGREREPAPFSVVGDDAAGIRS